MVRKCLPLGRLRFLLDRGRPAALLVLAMVAQLSCAASVGDGWDAPFDDVVLSQYTGHIRAGLSEPVAVEVGASSRSVLIEVEGSKGRYFLSSLVAPDGQDLVEAGQLVTRAARTVPGFVDWLVPNRAETQLLPGRYRLVVRAEAGDGGRIEDEDITIRVYQAGEGAVPAEECAIALEFIVADDALSEEHTREAVDWLAGRVRRIFSDAGLVAQTPTAVRLSFGSTQLDLQSDRDALTRVQSMLETARAAGASQPRTIPVLLVRSLSGLRGYTLGLPGPLERERPTAGVLVGLESFVGADGRVDLDAVATTVAHEVGHYLGLYHLSELDRRDHDPLSDTPECHSEPCESDFRENLMSPSGGSERFALSAQQIEVMRRHPLCH